MNNDTDVLAWESAGTDETLEMTVLDSNENIDD